MNRSTVGAQKPVIAVRNLSKIYTLGREKVVALKQLELDIYPGEICSIFGTSGAGKSMLLNQLAGLEKPSSGSIEILGAPINRLPEAKLVAFRQRHLGFVFQAYNLLPFMNAWENVALPLMFRGIQPRKRQALAKKMLERVGLGDRVTHFPHQMSGGQQQRVGIARAFVTKPAIIFADEPTGNLDSKTTLEVMQMMLDFAQHFKQTIIMVTHDPEMASFTDRVITLVDGEIVRDTKGSPIC